MLTLNTSLRQCSSGFSTEIFLQICFFSPVCLHQYGLMVIYTLGLIWYYFICFVVQIIPAWLLEAVSFGSFVPFTYYSHCVVLGFVCLSWAEGGLVCLLLFFVSFVFFFSTSLLWHYKIFQTYLVCFLPQI